MDAAARRSAEILWDYHRLDGSAGPADAIIALGGSHLGVARHAARLYRDGLAPVVVATGGVAHVGDLLATGWDVPEAEKFAEVFAREGVPPAAVLLETRAANTGENLLFSKAILEAARGPVASVLLSVKPHMQRRAYATGRAVWPGVRVAVSSWTASFADYCAPPVDADVVTNLMVGDLQRIDAYGRCGYQVPQDIPGGVWDAFHALVRFGYDRHLMKG